MKQLSIWMTVILVATLCASEKRGLAQEPRIAMLKLELQVSKQRYLLGEPIEVVFRLTNVGGRSVTLPSGIGVEVGNMTLWIAPTGGPYKRYSGPGWGMDDSVGGQAIVLKPGEYLLRSASVLYHRARSVEGEIDTYFAFTRAGRYLLRGVFRGSDPEIKSEPVPILLMEPQGVDAEVWKVMKDNPEYAFFIQTLGPTTWEKTERMTKTMEQLLEKYPTTTYAPHLRAAVESFYRLEVERKRFSRKAVEETLRQVGDLLKAGRQDYGWKMLENNKRVFLITGLFPKTLPIDAYVGLAYMMVKEYERAREYLDKVTAGLEPTRENRVVLEAAAFVRLALGEQEHAVQMLQRTRSGRERDTLLSRFQEQIKRGLTFSFEPYEDEVNTSDVIK